MCDSSGESIDGGVSPDYTMVEEKDGMPDATKLFTPYNITATVYKHYGIKQKKNPLKLKVVKKTVKAAKTANSSVRIKGALKVTKAKGTVTIRKKSGSVKFAIGKKGEITVKKGTKAGKYKIRVLVKASGTGLYSAAKKVVTVTVRVA